MTKRSKLGVLLGAGLLTLAVAGPTWAAKPEFGIDIVKSEDPGTLPAAGGVVTYTLVISNTGTADWHGVAITDANCDAAPTFKESSDGTDPSSNGSAGFLVAGASWTFTCTRDLTGKAAGDYTNQASVAGCADASSAQCNNATHAATADSNTVSITIPAAAPATATPAPATKAPGTTAPPTDAIGTSGNSGPSDGAWLLVVALGVLLASIVVLAPAKTTKRR